MAQRIAASRPADFTVGDDDSPYLRRWFVIPRNGFFNIYLHHFLKSDDDEALHDHPWLFNVSLILDGKYHEHTIKAGGVAQVRRRAAGTLAARGGASAHRVEIPPGGFCATLFITGPVVREWGFHCPKGWVHWKVFKSRKPDYADRAGKKYGCGEP